MHARLAVLSAIYEDDFLGFSCGFRPRRSQHDALIVREQRNHRTLARPLFLDRHDPGFEVPARSHF
jgi:hypothetical protein